MVLFFNGSSSLSITPKVVSSGGGGSALTAPSGLSASRDGGYAIINLSWTDNSTDEDGFKIERSTDGMAWSQIDTVGAGVTSYEDTGLDNGQIYYYRVRAYQGGSNSDYSNTDNATTYAPDEETNIGLWVHAGDGLYETTSQITAPSEDADPVGAMTDLGGDVSAETLEQGTDIDRPVLALGSNRINGNPTLYFDAGSGKYLESASAFLSATEGVIAIVYKIDNLADNTLVVFSSSDEGSTTRYFYIFAYEDSSDPDIRVDQRNNDTISAIRGSTEITADTPIVAILSSDGTVYTWRLNGTDQTEQVAAGSNNGDWFGDTDNRDNVVLGARHRTSVDGFFDGWIAELVVLKADDSITNLEQYLLEKYGIIQTYEVPVTTIVEQFLDSEYIESTSGVTGSVNSPTKDGDNPIDADTGANGLTWDYQKTFVAADIVSGTIRIFYGAVEDDDGNTDRAAYAYAATGTPSEITKDNLGIVTVDASTNNNLIIDDVQFVDMIHDGTYYVVMVEDDGTDKGIHLYRSVNPDSGFSKVKTIATQSSAGFYLEGKAIVQRPDGRWLAYYTRDQGTNQRSIGVYLSATSDYTGDWVREGTVIDDVSTTDQQYAIRVKYEGGIYLGFVMNYNATSEEMVIDLWTSRDGINWVKTQDTWLDNGASSSWEEFMVWNGSLVKNGDDWLFYYIGWADQHDDPRPKDSRLGLATIGYRRIGQYTGTGTVITTALDPSAGTSLYINCDASGGGGAKIEVELLDASDDSVITGYAQADCDDITSDTFETEITWNTGADTLLTDGTSIKVKFYITGATLYSYEIR